MPFTGDIFTKAFSFVTKFKPRGAIRRSDMDQMYDDLADGLNNTRGFTKDAGLGVTEPPLLANIDDTTKPTGFYATSTATTGAFPSGAAAGSVIYMRQNASFLMQIWCANDASRLWVRHHNTNDGGWQPWRGPQPKLLCKRQTVPLSSLTSSSYTLSATPIDIDHLNVVIDGVTQEPTEFSLSGAAVSYTGQSATNSNGWPIGINNIQFVYWCEV